MGTTFKELKRLTLLGMSNLDPKAKATATGASGTVTSGGKELLSEAPLVVEQSINDAIKALCSVIDIPEIFVTDTASALCVINQKAYHLVTHLALTRPKDIFSIRLIDGTSSKNLTYVPHKEWDLAHPYPEGTSTGSPDDYTKVGNYVELFRIPDYAYPLYVRYNQWPAPLVEETDECAFDNLDMQIVFLAKDIANAYMNGGYLDFLSKAREYLTLGKRVIEREPNLRLKAQPFSPEGNYRAAGEYWNDPLVKG